MYDVIRQDLIYRFKIDCMPYSTYSFKFPIKFDGTNFLLFFQERHAIVFQIDIPQELSVEPFVDCLTLIWVSISPDDLYVACCYMNGVLTIFRVEDGVTLQTVKLRQSPIACWWSELFLFVVFRDVVVKFSYDSTSTKVLGNCVEEYAIYADYVLEFEKAFLSSL